MSCYYIMFDTLAAFDTWHSAVKTSLAYPNPVAHTDAYTFAVPGKDGRYYAPVNSLCPAQQLVSVSLIPAEQVEIDTTLNQVVRVNGVMLG